MAGLRIGMAFASAEIINVFNKIKPPYNINVVSQQLAEQALNNVEQVNTFIKEIVEERTKLSTVLNTFSFIRKIYPSEANFILIKVDDPKNMYNYLISNQIIVRDRSKAPLCGGCLRITIGTQKENLELISTLKQYEKK